MWPIAQEQNSKNGSKNLFRSVTIHKEDLCFSSWFPPNLAQPSTSVDKALWATSNGRERVTAPHWPGTQMPSVPITFPLFLICISLFSFLALFHQTLAKLGSLDVDPLIHLFLHVEPGRQCRPSNGQGQVRVQPVVENGLRGFVCFQGGQRKQDSPHTP